MRLFDIGLAVAQGYTYHLVYPDRSSRDQRIVAFRNWILEEASLPFPPSVPDRGLLFHGRGVE